MEKGPPEKEDFSGRKGSCLKFIFSPERQSREEATCQKKNFEGKATSRRDHPLAKVVFPLAHKPQKKKSNHGKEREIAERNSFVREEDSA